MIRNSMEAVAPAFEPEGIPKPIEPINGGSYKIVDPLGHTLPPSKEVPTTFMAKLDEKGSQEITLRRSTLWFIGTGLVLATVVFSYGSSAVSWIRDDESQRLQIQQVQNELKSIKESQDKLMLLIEKEREARIVQEITNAKALGYQLKAAENPEHGAQK